MRHIVAEVIEHRSNGVEIGNPVEHHGSRHHIPDTVSGNEMHRCQAVAQTVENRRTTPFGIIVAEHIRLFIAKSPTRL